MQQKTKKILIIDDEEILRMLIVDTLEEEGYELEEAEDGLEGYEKILSNPYDLILLDYMMPSLTGMELLKKLQSKQLNTPIIMLTAKAQRADREAAKKFGATYFMPKPFSPLELLDLVNQVLHSNK